MMLTVLSTSGSPTLPLLLRLRSCGLADFNEAAVGDEVTSLQAVIAEAVSKHQKPSFPFGWDFRGIGLAAIQGWALRLAFVISHTRVWNKPPEDADPSRHTINTILYLVLMDGFLSRSTCSPWKRSSIFAQKLESGSTSELLLDFSTAKRRAGRQCSGVGRGQQSSALTVTSSSLYWLITHSYCLFSSLQMPSSVVITYE